MYKIIVFDMDWTLSKSKTKADDDMIKLLEKLSHKYMISVISWWNFNQYKLQFLDHLDKSKTVLNNFYLFPTNGTKMLYFEDNHFVEKYREDLTNDEVNKIETSVNARKMLLRYNG